jgi:hypothetical protein
MAGVTVLTSDSGGLQGGWLVGIAGSNPVGVIDVCLLWMLCVVR